MLMTSFTAYVFFSTYRGLTGGGGGKKKAAVKAQGGSAQSGAVDDKAAGPVERGKGGKRGRRRAPRVEVNSQLSAPVDFRVADGVDRLPDHPRTVRPVLTARRRPGRLRLLRATQPHSQDRDPLNQIKGGVSPRCAYRSHQGEPPLTPTSRRRQHSIRSFSSSAPSSPSTSPLLTAQSYPHSYELNRSSSYGGYSSGAWRERAGWDGAPADGCDVAGWPSRFQQHTPTPS